MDIINITLAVILGASGGYSANHVISKRRAADAAAKTDKMLDETRAHIKEIEQQAKKDESERRAQLAATERQMLSRQENLDRKIDELDKRQEGLRRQEAELETLKDELRAIRAKQQANLEKIAGLTRDDARDKLMQMTERDTRDDLTKLISKMQREAQDQAEDHARVLLTTAMERMASDHSAERTVTTVPLPNDEMKGRVIGKEGRNIQSLERATGVDIIVDETPGAIVLSSFDPIRRQVARVALERLLSDGRIHPGRIEELVAKAQKEIDRATREAGERAVKEVGVVGIPAEMVKLLGQLKYRTSYSQNVLKHSTEMAHLAGMIAKEVGANVRVAKTAALLHDVGKAVTHEIEGGHHHIGADLAEKHGMEEAITHAIRAHHDDVEATTAEAVIIRIVDALSAGRPGARGDNHENYAKRMTELENIANGFQGVQKSYAISAGRELRILVQPEYVDDLQAIRMARDIATKIEATLNYPGVVKVNVIRETRAVEYAK